jgi:hypothetical protein
LFAAKGPHKPIERALLIPLIGLFSLLPHLGQVGAVLMGSPQFGQAAAFRETSFLHPGQLINDMLTSSYFSELRKIDIII